MNPYRCQRIDFSVNMVPISYGYRKQAMMTAILTYKR